MDNYELNNKKIRAAILYNPSIIPNIAMPGYLYCDPSQIHYLFLMGIIQNYVIKAEAEAPQLPPYLVGNEETNSRYQGHQLMSTSIPGVGPGLNMCPQCC